MTLQPVTEYQAKRFIDRCKAVADPGTIKIWIDPKGRTESERRHVSWDIEYRMSTSIIRHCIYVLPTGNPARAAEQATRRGNQQ